MRLLLLLILIVNLLTACSDAFNSKEIVTQEPRVTNIPTVNAPPATVLASPTPLTTAEFQGISLSYDKSLMGTFAEAARSPAQAASASGIALPEHIKFTFNGSDRLSESNLHIFPIDHYEALSEATSTQIVDLKKLLTNRTAQISSPIPLYPTAYTIDEFLLQPSYVNFDGGYGVGFFAAVSDDPETLLVYAFQGLTDNGLNFVTTVIPLRGELLDQVLTSDESETLTQVSDRHSLLEAELAEIREDLNGALNSLSIPQSIAFSSPAPGAYLSIPGILLAYDPELYGVPIVKKRPPIFRNDEGESTYLPGVPDAISITFKSDKGEVEQQAELIVQPLRGATGQYYASIPDEQKQKVAAIEVLFSSGANGQPAEGNGGEDRKLFTFQNGIGQRVVEKGDPSDGLASQLLYKFEGITSDDRYFVEFKFPLNTAELLDSQVVAEDPADEAGYFMQLAQLDQMIQSLVIAANASTDSSLPVNPADCTRDAQFVEDISLPDHTFIEHGQAATKIWRIRNTGTCVWTPAFQIQFAGGNPISWSKPSVIDVVHPGEMTDIRVEIISPDTPGIYHAWWQLADELGRSFGPYYHVIFESPQPATNIPGYGVIEGELKYPAGGVPAMTIYFLSTDGSQRFALDTEDGWNRYANELPIGEYYVFAKVAGDESGSGGGFTELVLCDMTCDDHALIPVTIEEGVATREINIFDWYAPAGSFPLP